MVLYARDIVEKDFISLSRDTDALQAAKIMAEKKHGFVVVAYPGGKPEGMVTEWDYLSKVVASGRDPSSVTLEALMSRDLVSVNANDGIDHVTRLMAEKGIRRVLVVHDGKVIGVITSKTVLARMEEYLDRISSQIARMQIPTF